MCILTDYKGVSGGIVDTSNADDIVLCARIKEDLQQLLKAVELESEIFSLHMNVKTSKSMVFSKAEKRPRLCLELDGHILKQDVLDPRLKLGMFLV